MTLLALPWLELTILIPLVGGIALSMQRKSASIETGLAFTAAALLCSLLAWLSFELDAAPRRIFEIDGLSAPILPFVALLHFLVVLSTGGSKPSRLSLPLLLVGESIRLATFAVTNSWLLIALIAICTLPAFFELRQRQRSTRIFALHMSLSIVLIVLGKALLDVGAAAGLACIPLLAGVLIRCGVVPAHLWVADLFEKVSFAKALLFTTPILGIYAAVRLVLPVAPDWVLNLIGLFSLATAVYGAGLALVQTDIRRFFAMFFLSQAAMVAVGLQLNTPISLTGALCLWYAAALSLAGLGLTLRAVEARYGPVPLTRYRGLYDKSPLIAVSFLITGLGTVGFPGTLGFVSAEMLAGGAVGASPIVGVVLAIVAALNGIAVVRVYYLLFTGCRHETAIPLDTTPRERLAFLILAALILGGGLFPQPFVESRDRAAAQILEARAPR